MSKKDDEAFAKWVEEQVVKPMSDSKMVIGIYTGKVDVKLAVELGASLLLDKPIILCVTPGTVVSDNLVRVAKHIIEMTDGWEKRLPDILGEIL